MMPQRTAVGIKIKKSMPHKHGFSFLKKSVRDVNEI
jgi:hypothetical protein